MIREETEHACATPPAEEKKRHAVEMPELTLRRTFYPMGFPTEVHTNSAEVLTHAEAAWSMFERSFETPPVRVDVHVVDTEEEECPPAPNFRLLGDELICIANGDNYTVANLAENRTHIVVCRSTLRYASYFNYFYLGPAPLGNITYRFVTAVHAGCVALEGRGVLLCGESGMGKSTLSYACARAGWTYVADDASFLLHTGVAEDDPRSRRVVGNCHQVRFRPSAAEIFPEVAGMEITPRAVGKPSIEMPTAPMKNFNCASTAQVEFLVFLNRSPGKQELRPHRRDLARLALREVLFGPDRTRAPHHAALERLLTAEVYELCYSDLDWAIDRLETLVMEGR